MPLNYWANGRLMPISLSLLTYHTAVNNEELLTALEEQSAELDDKQCPA